MSPAEARVIRLDQCPKSVLCRVVEVTGGAGVREHLNHLGVHEGDTIQVVRSGAFRGPILIRSGGREIALGRGIAAKIRVERVE